MTKFTPGPWHRGITHESGDTCVTSTKHGYVACLSCGSAQEKERNIANADLISAAPELLESAQYFEYVSSCYNLASYHEGAEVEITVTVKALKDNIKAIMKALGVSA